MLIPEQFRTIHFVGIGGAGMSGLAEIFHRFGFSVQGSDLWESPTTQRLQRLGIRVFYGHSPEHVENAQAVVFSSAVPLSNPEIQEARRRNLPVIPRAEMLAELMRMKYAIAVSGAHGKTTTTSMIGFMLHRLNLSPTTIVGGILRGYDTGAVVGTGPYVVAEADESDRSFLKLYPTIAVATNIDREHLATYRSVLKIQEAFLDFLNRVPFYGASVVCVDNRYIRDILPELERRVVSYGIEAADALLQARHIHLEPLSSRFEVVLQGHPVAQVHLPLPGLHNVQNALAALAVAWVLDLDIQDAAAALASFQGVARRFEIRHRGDFVWVDDYGHHPTEIRAVLRTAGRFWTGRRVVLFQPHRYTRTHELYRDFAEVFAQELGKADRLGILPIYPAGEPPIPGVSHRLIGDLLRPILHDRLTILEETDGIPWLTQTLQEGDLLLTLGAGPVYRYAEALVEQLSTGS